MRLPTLYSTLDELNLDMHILGKVLQVPSQSLEDLTFTLKEEMKIKNPLPTLEKRRYKISDEVSDDYEITYEEELELAENEECVNLSLENIEVNESEPIISVNPEYKAYFKYENHATSSMLDEFLSGDTTRFNGNISQLGTTKLKEDLELTDREIERLSETNETWGSDGLDFDATTEDKEAEPVFETGTDDEDEYTFSADIEPDTEEMYYTAEEDDAVSYGQNIGGIEFIENKTLTDLDVYFTYDKDTSILEFIENYELQNLDEVADLTAQNDNSSLNFIENYELSNLDEVVELSSYATDSSEIENEDFDDFEDEDFDIPEEDEDLDDLEEDEDFDIQEEADEDDTNFDDFDVSDEDDTEEDTDEGVSEDFDDLEDEFAEFNTEVSNEDDSNIVSDDIDFGTETELTHEAHQGGTEETIVSDEDLGFIDTSPPEELDFGSSTVSNTKEDDAYINKVLNNKSIPEALKKELIRDYLETQSRGAVEVDLGTETVQNTTVKEEKAVQEEVIEYKDIRHFVRDHPRCTVQDVLKHFSKKQLEHDIMVGKVIRKGKILHI